MEKKSKAKWDTYTLIFLGFLAAMNIVLTRIAVIELGFARITLGAVATILAGLWFGPVGGGAVGLVSDILGCFMRGYAVNPLITFSAILWGVIPGLAVAKISGGKKKMTAVICVSIVVTSVLATLVSTTAGLVLINGYNFYSIMPGRLAQWAALTPVYCIVTCILYFSPLTHLVYSSTRKKAAA
ncbi:MAG: folate family ECF transporter S component [Eubacteriales bacterium]|nr:folate family ECF transporter S component [Eubacteriales bacterium]